MPDNQGEVMILAEKIGLKADASGADIVARVYELAERVDRADKILAEKEHLLLRAKDGEEAKAKLKEVEAKLFIERAISNQWIDKKDESFYVEMYMQHPEKVQKHIEDQKYRSFMTGSKRLREEGDNPKSALERIDAMAASLMASDKNLSKSDADAKVLSENPDLEEQYRLEVVMGAKGGGR